MSMTPEEKLFDVLKTADIHWFNSAVNLSLKGRYLYVENPKVASSTIKTKLHANELIGLKNIRVGPHPDIAQSPFVKPYQLPIEDAAEYVFGGDFFKFTFVRNPFHRLLSSYLDKIVGQAPEKGQIDAIWTRIHGGKKDNYTFAEFVEAIGSIPDVSRDKHWRTQTRITMANHINYSFVGRFEQLAAHLSKIESMSRIDFSNLKEVSPHKTDAAARLKEFYTDDLAREVARIYDVDFVQFVYKKEL